MSLDDLLEGDTARTALAAGINLALKGARIYNSVAYDIGITSMNRIGQFLVAISDSIIEDGEIETEDISQAAKTLGIGLGSLRAIKKLIDYIMP